MKKKYLVIAIAIVSILLLIYILWDPGFPITSTIRGVVHDPPPRPGLEATMTDSTGTGKTYKRRPYWIGKNCKMVYGATDIEVFSGTRVWVHYDTIGGENVAVIDCLRKGNPNGCPEKK